jgi:hypothetical protein
MDTVKNLIDGATATDATKVVFELTATDFQNGVMPALRSRGLGAGDDINLFTWVNGGWDAGKSVVDDVTEVYNLVSIGKYAVTITMTLTGPAHCDLSSATMKL